MTAGPSGSGPGTAGHAGAVALALVLGALLLGALVRVELGGRTFVVSWIDVTAAGVALAGVASAWRRREVRVDLAVWAYSAFLAVTLAQALVSDVPLDVLGGSSRFVTAALVLVGVTQLRVTRAGWELAVAGFGVVLGAWVVVLLGLALADPDLRSFYAVKNAVVTPLGASNTLAGYLLVPAVAAVVLAGRDRRWWLPGAVATAGVVATLSRGALAALVVALVHAAVRRPAQRVALGLTAALAVAGTLALFTLVGPGATPPAPPPPAAPDAPLLDPVDADAVGASPVQRVTPSVDGRLALWRASAGAFLDRPLLGVGLNRITEVTAGLRQPHDHAHNALLHALVESGLLGTAAYLALWGTLVVRLRRAAPSATRTALAAGAVALALHAQVEALTYQRGIEVVVAVLLAGAATLAGAGGVATWPGATLAPPPTTPPGSSPGAARRSSRVH